MKVYGYEKNCEDIIELEEISFQTNIDELKKLLKFIETVIEKHEKVVEDTPICHSHFRDFDDKWDLNQPDIIFATISDKK